MLEHACELHIGLLFRDFIDSVSSTKSKKSAMIAAAERFKTDVDLARAILERAKFILKNQN